MHRDDMPDLPVFVCSAKFQGHKKGYVFKNGDEGIGYYLDITYPGDISESTSKLGNESAEAKVEIETPKLVTVDIPRTLQTLAPHMKSLKKIPKANDLVIQLLTSTLNEQNSSLFYNFIEEINLLETHPLKDMNNQTIANASIKLYSTFYEHRKLFTFSQQYDIITWYISGHIQPQLQTDDSFHFVRITKTFQEIIEQQRGLCDDSTIQNILTEEPISIPTPKDETATRKRVEAILQSMEVAYKNYPRAWAKQSIDRIFAAAASRRLTMPEDLRERLDTMTTNITTEQRKSASGADIVNTIRTYDSVAHPLLQKRTGILR
eukprot:gene11092-23191_t